MSNRNIKIITSIETKELELENEESNIKFNKIITIYNYKYKNIPMYMKLIDSISKRLSFKK